MKMKRKFILIAVPAIVACFASCKKEKNNDGPVSADYSHGVLISNEGSFSSGSGTVTHFNRDSKKTLQNIFQDVNGFPLGNLVQSLAVSGDQLYIVVNNSQKVEVVNLESFSSTGTISQLEQPRYFLGINSSKGYITQWGDGSKGELKVVDLASHSILKTVDIGKGSERMLQSGNNVFICNAGGYNPTTYDPVNDSAVSVVDAQTDNLVQRIPVGYNPSGIVNDANGKLWVICQGINDYNNTANNRPGCLVKINPSTFTVELTLPFPTNYLGMRLTIDDGGENIYYQYNESVYKMQISATVLPVAPLIARSFYALGYDSATHLIYGSDAGNFNSNGYVIRYEESGALIDSFMVGIGPGNFVFLPQ